MSNEGTTELWEIRSRFDRQKVSFSVELENGSIKLALEAAVKASVDLSGAELAGCNLDDAHLPSAKLSGANLRGASLEGANLNFSDLSGANLVGASLHHALLEKALLENANLSRANLNLANLDSADFRGAILYNVTMTGAKTNYTDFNHANWAEKPTKPKCIKGKGPVLGNVSLTCPYRFVPER